MSTETTAPTTTETEHVTGLAKPFQAAGNGKKRAVPLTEPFGVLPAGAGGHVGRVV